MAITNTFKDAVGKGDVTGLRIMMKDSLLIDPKFSDFKEMDNLARTVSGLYDPHDGREFKEDKTAWDDDYMNKLMVQVVGNFSHERVNHLKEVVRHLRPTGVHTETPSSISGSSSGGNRSSCGSSFEESSRNQQRPYTSYYQKQKMQDAHDNRIVPGQKVKIAAGVIAGGVAGGVVAATVGSVMLTTAGVVVGAIVGGNLVANKINGGH